MICKRIDPKPVIASLADWKSFEINGNRVKIVRVIWKKAS
jgi:hypothetical protein